MSDPLATDVSIDMLIARRLPVWLQSASADQHAALRNHLLAQQRAHSRAQRLLDAIPALPAFAETLLSPALERELGCRLDVRASQLDLVFYVPEASAGLGLARTFKRHASKQSLLAAALHNFEASEAEAGAFSIDTKLVDAAGQRVDCAPERFARLCRALDIGGQYQRQLKTTLTPGGEAGKAVDRILEGAFRTALRADVSLARSMGRLDQDNYRRLQALAASVVPPDAHVLKPYELRVLGKRVRGAVAIEVWSGDAAANLDAIVAWIPGDPVAAVSLHASWRGLSVALAGRFAVPGYRAFFAQLLATEDQAAFDRLLTRKLQEADPRVPIEIDGRHEAITGDVFVHLRRRQIEGILADAKVLAVPTDEEDRQARAARLEGYVSAGFDLLGLASLFVPGIGVALLGVAAVQLASEVYEGYEDWQLGDREAALGHLFDVAESVVGNALTLTAPGAALRLARRVPFVDGLAPVATAGGLRLLDPSLPGYAVQALEGAERSANVQYIDGKTGRLRLERANERSAWSVVHPTRRNAYSPSVEGHARGGWRHALEQPQHWDDACELVRRLDGETTHVSERAVRFALEATATNLDQVRRLHVESAPAPARLRDALQRYELHERFPTLRGAAFEAHMAAAQPVVQDAAQVLRRDFPNLTPRCANELVEGATQAQLQRLTEEQRIPLALAQQARWMLHDARLDRACAGLLLDQAVVDDTVKLALGLVDEIAPWPEDIRVEVRQDTPQGALIAQSIAKPDARARVIVSRQGHYYCVDTDGTLLAGSRLDGSLNEALLSRLEPLQKLLLGKADLSAAELGECLAARASRSRDRSARVLGLVTRDLGFRPPVRPGDGRLGYPLSGRGESSRQAFARGLRQLYPTFSDIDIERYLNALREQGIDPWNHLHELNLQLTSLRATLDAWQAEPDTWLQRMRRREVATRIRRCWRRKQGGQDGSHLLIEGERVGRLPALPESVDFGHVRWLMLRDMTLTEVPEAFLRSFERVQILDLRFNQLTRLPRGLEALTEVRELRLSYNRIVWNTESDRQLAALTHLNQLELSGNPLRVAPDLSTLRNLRYVTLRDTLLTQVPLWPQQRPFVEGLDLRDNAIERLQPSRSHFFLRRLFLQDNPLNSASLADITRATQPEGASGGVPDIVHSHVEPDARIRDLWLRHAPSDERAALRTLWDGLHAEPGSADLLRFFGDLTNSDDFLSQPRQLAERVWRILRACERDAQVREVLFQQAAGPRTCADRALLVLSQLEVGRRVAESTRGRSDAQATRALVRLGRSMRRLDEVNRIATWHIERLRRQEPILPVDDIEVIMAYRVGLAESLGLPEQPGYMYFEAHSRVSAQDLVRARADILAGETTQVLADDLVGRDFWVEHLRQRFGHLIEEMNAPFHARLEALDTWNEQFGEQAYLEKVEALAREREAAERGLLLRLTLIELQPN